MTMGSPNKRIAAFIAVVWFGALPDAARAGHTLTEGQKRTVSRWLSSQQGSRLADVSDCQCDDDIRQVRVGYGAPFEPVPDYHPYVATGDFNGDGLPDFAVVVISEGVAGVAYRLVVFNGSSRGWSSRPVFEASLRDMIRKGLFFGPPRPRPFRLTVGPFESDNTEILVPRGKTYRLEAE